MFEGHMRSWAVGLLILAVLPGVSTAQNDGGRAREGLAQQERAREVQAAGATQESRAAREQQLERLRSDLDRARRDMEAAAREIARITATGPRPAVAPGGRGAFLGPPTAAIGANVENTEAGALVVGVSPGGPAEAAGILSGDVIVEIGGRPTVVAARRPVDVVVEVLGATEPGAAVGLTVVRAGERLTVDVTTDASTRFMQFVRGLPDNPGFAWVTGELPEMPDLPDLPDMAFFGEMARDVTRRIGLSELFATRWRDMELATLSDELGSYFGTQSGVLVVRAPDNEDLDLRDGDVILAIGGRVPTSPEHAMQILASFVPGEQLELDVMRRQRRQTVRYTIPDPDAVPGAAETR